MKFPTITGLTLAACALASTAQAEIKVAAVNMQDLYKSFYKRVEAEKRLNATKTDIEEEMKSRAEKLKALGEELNAINKKNDPALSQAARQKIQAEFTAKVNQAQASEQEFNQFRQRRELAFKEMQRREILILLQDIQKIIDEAAAAGDYDLLINSGAASPPLGTMVFPFVKKTLDITPEMMEKLNAGAPAGYDPAAEVERANGTAGGAAEGE